MDSKELAELIKGSKILKQERGGNKNELIKEEQVTRDFAFATVVTIAKVKKGDMFSNKNIWVKRPGVGEIQAEEYESLFSKKATRTIDIDEHLKWEDVD